MTGRRGVLVFENVRPDIYIYIYAYIQFDARLIPSTKTNTHPTLVKTFPQPIP
jgi:hypothetical protein